VQGLQNLQQMESKPTEVKGPDLLSISQSLLKNWWDYKAEKFCGAAFHRINILKEAEFIPSEAMKLGHYFEYLCTGATLRDGTIPEQPQTTTKKPTAGAVRMIEQAEKFKMLVKKENIVVEDTGTVLEVMYPYDGFKMKGVLDILGTVNGVPSIIDIKSSGLIGNEWEAYGWHKGTFNMRSKLTIQVVFYKYLAWKQWGTVDMPFYFIVHSTTNAVDSLFWEIKLKDFEVAMNTLEDMVFEAVEEIKVNMEYGFNPYPTVKGCAKCAINKDCATAITTPAKEVITIDGIFG